MEANEGVPTKWNNKDSKRASKYSWTAPDPGEVLALPRHHRRQVLDQLVVLALGLGQQRAELAGVLVHPLVQLCEQVAEHLVILLNALVACKILLGELLHQL